MQLDLLQFVHMLPRDYDSQTCSIARTLEIVGERWTILILRNVALGIHRFDNQQRQLGVARNVLAARFERLVQEGILERRPYGERPVRHEYHFSDKGRALWPVVVELMVWGDRYAPAPGGPPRILRHQDCGGAVGRHSRCDRCGALLELEDMFSEPGPGADALAKMLGTRPTLET
jgi:DNA-binding HxlR family transcriptional regulator